VLANARVWQSEGWQVTITDPDGNEFDAVGFESMLSQKFPWVSESRAQPAATEADTVCEAEETNDFAFAAETDDAAMLEFAEDAEPELVDQDQEEAA